MGTPAAAKQVLYPPMPGKVTPGLLIAHVFCFVILSYCILAALNFDDKESAMAFYGVYHQEPWNQVIHFFGVPMILLTFFVLAAHLPLTSRIVLQLPQPHYITWATVWACFYFLFYLTIDVVGALLYAPILYGCYMMAVRWTWQDQKQAKLYNASASWTGTGRLLQWALVLHVLSWYLQIHAGHKILEGAQPAVMQSLGGSLTSAPLFAFYEGVWFVGLRREFQQAVLQRVDEYTRELCASGDVTMRACENLSP